MLSLLKVLVFFLDLYPFHALSLPSHTVIPLSQSSTKQPLLSHSLHSQQLITFPHFLSRNSTQSNESSEGEEEDDDGDVSLVAVVVSVILITLLVFFGVCLCCMTQPPFAECCLPCLVLILGTCCSCLDRQPNNDRRNRDHHHHHNHHDDNQEIEEYADAIQLELEIDLEQPSDESSQNTLPLRSPSPPFSPLSSPQQESPVLPSSPSPVQTPTSSSSTNESTPSQIPQKHYTPPPPLLLEQPDSYPGMNKVANSDLPSVLDPPQSLPSQSSSPSQSIDPKE